MNWKQRKILKEVDELLKDITGELQFIHYLSVYASFVELVENQRFRMN
jgi:hypothetical protein